MRSQSEIIENILQDHDQFSIVGTTDAVTIFCRACDSILGSFPPSRDALELASGHEGRVLLRGHQAALIDQTLRKTETTDTRMDVLRSIATSRSGLAAAVNVMAGDDPSSMSEAKREMLDGQAVEIISAYLLAPMDTGHFDFDEGDPEYETVINKVQELLDRGLRDADIIVSLASTELARTANISATQTHLLRCALRESEEATTERDRFRDALASAEADRHPCSALHLRVDELRRRIGESHGFVLVGCASCGTEMISQSEAGEDMELCSRCTEHVLGSLAE